MTVIDLTDAGPLDGPDDTAGLAVEPSAPRARRTPPRWPAAVALGVICAVGLAARLHEISAQSMWLDEAVSSWYADHGIIRLWSWAHPLDPYHPPGYYSLLALWQVGGHSEAWLRGLSAIVGVSALPFTYAATRRVANRSAGLIAAALLAVAPLQVRFGQETRTYSLMVLEAAVILWSLTWLLRYPRIASAPLRGNPARRYWFAYVGASGAVLLSHNTGPLVWVTAVVAGVLHWWLTPGRTTSFLWAWARANLAVGALWLAWLPVFVRQSMMTLQGSGHRKVPGPDELVTAFRDLSLGQSAVGATWTRLGDLLAVAVLVTAVVLTGRRARARRWALTLAVFVVMAPVAEYVASVLGKPVFLTQSLLWVGVPFAMLVGLLAVQLPRLLTVPVAAVAVAVALVGLSAYYPNAHKEPWRDAAAFLRPRLEAGDLVVYSADYAMIPMQYYLHEPPGVTQIGTMYQPPDIATVRREIPDAHEVWLVYAHWEFGDPNRWVHKVLAERGDQVEHMSWGEEIQLFRFLPRPPGGTSPH